MATADWSSIAEVIGAIAIIVTLVYLATQVRQTRQQALADAMRKAMERWTGVQAKAYATEESVRFLRKALNDYTSLTPEEKGRLTGFMLEMNASHSSIIAFRDRGLLEQEVLDEVRRFMIGLFRCPGVSDWYKELRHLSPRHLQEETDRFIEESAVPPLSTELPYFSPIDDSEPE